MACKLCCVWLLPGSVEIVHLATAEHWQVSFANASSCSCVQGRKGAACTTKLWTYLQAQLLNHSIYGLVNILLDGCVTLIPNKLFVLDDLQSVVQEMG